MNGTWLLSGDQRIAKIQLQAEELTNQGQYAAGGAFSGGPAGAVINAGVAAPQGTVTGATLTGNNPAGQAVFNSTVLTPGPTRVDTFAPTPTTQITLNLDTFGQLSSTLSSVLPAGTPFTFALTTGNGLVNYALNTNVFTTEGVSITTNFGGDAISNAGLGSPLTVNWTLPTTYGIAQVQLTADVFTGAQGNPATLNCRAQSPLLATSATTGTITIPATCGGLPVLEVNLEVQVRGVDGEQSQAMYGFN